jgi:hypothetical protein
MAYQSPSVVVNAFPVYSERKISFGGCSTGTRRKMDDICMGKASRGVAWHKCMRDATDPAYPLVVLKITGYAAIYSVLCAAAGLKQLWLLETGTFLNVDFSCDVTICVIMTM